MSNPAKRPADLIDPSSFVISEPLPAMESRSAKLYWWRQTLALAFSGLVIVLGDDLRFPWASAGSLSLAEKRGAPANHEAAQLMVSEAAPKSLDQPVPLGVSVDRANDLYFLKVSGLPKGSALSAGVSVGDDEWLIYAQDSKDAVIRPPPHFVGVME